MQLINKLFLLLLIFFLFLFNNPNLAYAGFSYGSYLNHYTLTEITTELDNMRANYPNLISAKESIGTSIEGRPIYMVKISDNPDMDEDEKEVLYMALIHGSEPQGMDALMYFMYYLLENYETNTSIKYLVDNRELYFVPVINVDGYVRHIRKNRRNNGDGSYGVDLNRNFGPEASWNGPYGGSSTTPSSSNYRGTAPCSEPETQAIRDFLRLRQVKVGLSYHCCANLFIYPYIYKNENTADHAYFSKWGSDLNELVGYFPGKATEAIHYQSRGSFGDFAYEDDLNLRGKILTIEPEVRYLDPFLTGQENLSSNLYLAWIPDFYVNLYSYELSKSNPGPGESLTVKTTFLNNGLNAVDNISGTLTSTSPYITISDNTETLGSFNSLGSTTFNNAFQFTISPSAPAGTSIDLIFKTYYNDILMETKTKTIYVSRYPSVVFVNQAESYGVEGGIKQSLGASWPDFDNDGYNDLFVLGNYEDHSLYINNAPDNQKFSEVNETYGISGNSSLPYKADWLDIDNDGDLDLYIINYGQNNKLYLNNGPGVAFTDGTNTYQLGDSINHTGSSWIDIDNDGDLDLYSLASTSKLYINNGPNKPFTEQTAYGLSGISGIISTTWFDIDNDGDLDLYIVICGQNNKLYLNNGPGQPFTDATAAYNLGLGTDCHINAYTLDINNDGNQDLYVLNSSNANLLLNNGSGTAFTDVTSQYDIASNIGSNQHLSASIIDINNDSYPDISLLYVNIDDVLYVFDKELGKFVNKTTVYQVQDNFLQEFSFSWVDFDEDGDLDLFLPNPTGKDKLLVNPGQENNYLAVNVRNSSGIFQIGSRIEVDLDGNGDFSPTGKLRIIYQGLNANGKYKTSFFPQEEYFGLGSDSSCKYDVRVFLPGISPLSGSPSFSYINVCPKQTLTTYSPEVFINSVKNLSSQPNFSGTATATLNNIANVQYQVDVVIGTWQNCNPKDGSFDSKDEPFECIVTQTLSAGTHTIYVRAMDSVRVTSLSSLNPNAKSYSTFNIPGSSGTSLGSTDQNTQQINTTNTPNFKDTLPKPPKKLAWWQAKNNQTQEETKIIKEEGKNKEETKVNQINEKRSFLPTAINKTINTLSKTINNVRQDFGKLAKVIKSVSSFLQKITSTIKKTLFINIPSKSFRYNFSLP